MLVRGKMAEKLMETRIKRPILQTLDLGQITEPPGFPRAEAWDDDVKSLFQTRSETDLPECKIGPMPTIT